jgi:hypothetical protein
MLLQSSSLLPTVNLGASAARAELSTASWGKVQYYGALREGNDDFWYCAEPMKCLDSILRTVYHADFHTRSIMLVDGPGGIVELSGILDWDQFGY